MLIASVVAGVLLPMLHAAPAGAAPEPPPEPRVMEEGPHARATLVADVLTYKPGRPFTLGVTFDIDENWHLYWQGANDSGFPPAVEVRLPEGWTMGDWQWPAPVRHETTPGQILDFIYEHRVTLFAEVTPAKSASGPVDLEASAEWLVCQEACIPGDALLSIQIPEGPATKPSDHVELFDEARARIPRPLDAEAISRFVWKWSRGSLRITPVDRLSLTFAPSLAMPPLADRFRSTASKPGETLVIALGQGDGEPGVSGVLEVFDAQDQSVAIYHLEIPLGAMPSPAAARDEESPSSSNP